MCFCLVGRHSLVFLGWQRWRSDVLVLTSWQSARIKALARENRELKQANEFLRKAVVFFRPDGARPQTEVMLEFIARERGTCGAVAHLL